jgi:hypothetical protein
MKRGETWPKKAISYWAKNVNNKYRELFMYIMAEYLATQR